jgi:hypothetical protein
MTALENSSLSSIEINGLIFEAFGGPLVGTCGRGRSRPGRAANRGRRLSEGVAFFRPGRGTRWEPGGSRRTWTGENLCKAPKAGGMALAQASGRPSGGRPPHRSEKAVAKIIFRPEHGKNGENE